MSLCFLQGWRVFLSLFPEAVEEKSCIVRRRLKTAQHYNFNKMPTHFKDSTYIINL